MRAATVYERLVEPQRPAVAVLCIVSAVECVERFGGNILVTVVAARVEHHLKELEEIRGGREKACMSGDATHSGGVGVVHIAA